MYPCNTEWFLKIARVSWSTHGTTRIHSTQHTTETKCSTGDSLSKVMLSLLVVVKRLLQHLCPWQQRLGWYWKNFLRKEEKMHILQKFWAAKAEFYAHPDASCMQGACVHTCNAVSSYSSFIITPTKAHVLYLPEGLSVSYLDCRFHLLLC